MEIGIGKIRGLQQIADSDGILSMCAMDHRGSLRSMIAEECNRAVEYSEMVGRKIELCSILGKHASAVLLDPVFGAAQCISRTALPRDTGLLVSIEATGYSGGQEQRLTQLLEGWGVEKIKRMGASAVKILVYYRPDLKELARQQRDVISKVANECIRYDIPFLVEPKSFPVGDEINNPAKFAAIKEQLVIQSVVDITALPIDVLKGEFPVDLGPERSEAHAIEICRQLNDVSRVPWVILSAGVDFELFCRQVEIACKAGASGFLGGRAIWQEAMNIDNEQKRVGYLSTVAVDRLKKLIGIASRYGVPWYRKFGGSVGELAKISESWYKEY